MIHTKVNHPENQLLNNMGTLAIASSQVYKDIPKSLNHYWIFHRDFVIKGPKLIWNEKKFVVRTWKGGNDRVIIAFRGTDPKLLSNLIADAASVVGTKFVDYNKKKRDASVGIGFYLLYKAFSMALFPYCKQFDRIYITGHSLGAALATLFFYDLRVSRGQEKLSACVFGSPRVGHENWRKSFKKYNSGNEVSFTRWVNNPDPITQIPKGTVTPPTPFFYHVGRPVHFSDGNIFTAHSMDKYKKHSTC